MDIRQNVLQIFPTLPPSSSLEQIFLGFNRLVSIPKDALACVSGTLKVLDVRDNQLEKVPEGLCAVIGLKMLDVSNNNLSDLPHGLGYLKLLDRLLLEGNPFRGIRRSIIAAGHQAVKKYLRSRGGPMTGVDGMAQEYDEFTIENAPKNVTHFIHDAMGTKHLVLDSLR